MTDKANHESKQATRAERGMHAALSERDPEFARQLAEALARRRELIRRSS